MSSPEKCGIELQCLWNHLTIRQHPRADYLNARQVRGSIKDPQRRVIQIAARDEPLVSLVYGPQGMRSSREELDLRVTFPNLLQLRAKVHQRLIVAYKETSVP